LDVVCPGRDSRWKDLEFGFWDFPDRVPSVENPKPGTKIMPLNNPKTILFVSNIQVVKFTSDWALLRY